jgi:hypothetical protein
MKAKEQIVKEWMGRGKLYYSIFPFSLLLVPTINIYK